MFASTLAFVGVLVWAGASDAAPSEPSHAKLETQFTTTVRPFLQTYCVACHGKTGPQAQLDLTAFNNVASVVRDYSHWALVLEKLAEKQMPPRNFGKQPTAKQREAVIGWIRALRQSEAQRTAGDPGPVLARRLSNAEYDYTIRDLTGVDLRPTREFPVDPATQEGFDNSGESLTLSPALMKKYVMAAKEISDHLVLTSTGLEFAAHPVLAETDRDKYCILRIVDFYKQQPTDYADYFAAAWQYRHRAALGTPQATLAQIAAKAKVSPGYLTLVWKTLTTPGEKVGPLAKLQEIWNALPAPEKGKSDTLRRDCIEMRDWVVALRKKVAWKFENLRVPGGFSTGGQCFVLWKDQQYASHRRMLYPDRLQVGGQTPSKTIPARRNRPAQTVVDSLDPDLYVPKEEAERAPYVASFNQFCNVFPDAFYIAERGRMFVDDPGDQGRLLTAGLHNSMGYFRDDTPLMELILDEKGRKELDHLWQDFDMVAFVPERMHLEFIFYERAESRTIIDSEFNFARSEDKGVLSNAVIKQLGDLYLAKARRNGGEPLALQAIEEHFKWVATTIRATERARLAAEPLHLKTLLDFARRAYRRPLAEAERTEMLTFYRSLRQKDGLTHEDALRDTLIRVLMSPKFLFRLDLEAAVPSLPSPEGEGKKYAYSPSGEGKKLPLFREGWVVAHVPGLQKVNTCSPFGNTCSQIISPKLKGTGIQPLSDYALSSRLSYFLWSSLPDEELLRLAKAGTLHRPEILAAQAGRMLRDSRVRALALEFGGNWLDFRRFEEHQAVDRERFPAFTDELRTAMFEEPLHFMMHTFQQNSSVLDWLYGKYTFVNAPLAKHYGMNEVTLAKGEWKRVENADRYGRGGLFPMGVFLTKNSPGLRTSPVKRGYWVVRRLLGETIPPPPPTVPQLPADESKLGNLTLRQALVAHRENPACAGCHARFDSYGLVFEGYGPIGELRSKDLSGKPVDASAPFPGGTERNGVTGLRDFVRQQRQQDFLDTFGRKLLSYALGRSLQLSDEPLLLQMQQRLKAQNYRFGTLVESIVTSPQFRNRRVSTPVARLSNL